MNIIVGLIFIGVAVGSALLFLPMFAEEEDRAFKAGMTLLIAPCIIGLGLFGAALIFSPGSFDGEPLVENACYRAYGKNTIVPVGKVFVPIHDVVLVEIRCP